MSTLKDAFFIENYDKYLKPLSRREVNEFSERLSKNNALAGKAINLLYNSVKTCHVLGYGCARCFEILSEILISENQPELLVFNTPKVFTLVIYYFLLGRREFGLYEIEIKKMNKVTTVDTDTDTDTTTNIYSEDITTVNSWDEYFYNVARQAARNSKCFSRKIGAVLVKDKSIVGTGYNSPPRGIGKCDTRWGSDESIGEAPNKNVMGKCPRQVLGKKSGEAMELCPASHAEESAIVNSARMGISTKDSTLYLCCGVPCGKCAVKIINAGISEVVVTNMNFYDKLSAYLFKNSGIKLRLYSFLQNKS